MGCAENSAGYPSTATARNTRRARSASGTDRLGGTAPASRS
ncbi:hypothetical protein OF850_11655 [Roseococcus sp. MDT2-1-1]|uniref:Uncharacterized protein n=1 Tax=Sabulicella glaciei TaxID=2984948 RepID=A0ABT3NVV1_9PROT|nr:hypothetical protein [Roseococcus sp. MDT2-1-1]